MLSNKLSDNNLGFFAGGGASGSAFGGIGISNFTVMSVGLVLLAGLTAHILTRKQAQDKVRYIKAKNMANMQAQADWDAVPYADKRRKSMHHTGHQPPANYDEAANDLFAFASSITLPDTAIDNADRIKECIHRHNPHIREIMDSVRTGAMEPREAHHRIHGLAQNITEELGLPHRESINTMPYTIGNVD